MKYRFAEFEIDDDRREVQRNGKLVPIEPQVFDVLCVLLRNRDRVVSRDELIETVWNGRIVSDAALSSRIRDLRAALADDGRAQTVIRTIHGHGFRFVGELCESDGSAHKKSGFHREPLAQEVRYLRSFDDTRIAYAETGTGETTVVKTANWMSHLEYDLESPIWRHWIEALSQNNRLIRYDERGNGMSDWTVPTVTFEDCVRDLECLVDELGLKDIVLFGISQGASVAVDFATRHPELVRKIVIYGGFVHGWRFAKDENVLGQRVAMSMLMRTGWGQPTSEFRQLFTSRFMPEATQEQADWFNELQFKSVAPDMAAQLHDMFGTIDVSHCLDQVKAPTLVLHARGDVEIDIQNGREFATGIPGARFVSLESQNHILLEDEPAFAALVTQVRNFLSE